MINRQPYRYSKHIGKPLTGFLEPGVTCPRDYSGDSGINTKPYPVRQSPPDKHGPRLLNNEGKRVGHKPRLNFLRQCGYGIENRGKKQHNGGNYTNSLPDIPQETT